MKFVAILLLSSLTIAMVLAFPSNDDKNAALPADNQYAAALASPSAAGSADTSASADQISNSIRRPRYLLSKLFQPKTVVVQPVIVEQVVPAQYPGYAQPYPGYYNQGRRIW
ncbi:uncharacterized protein LOC108029390 [Drosophila biarmipes]|uniref:uncharacterized protein LOC108029390 n=1 Tax=Drosophila biarmipes TaxID=125945 RepID=UPI0007E72BF1|nr:uncharacterized protein LOC108029390 [Drosophila biarmipes]